MKLKKHISPLLFTAGLLAASALTACGGGRDASADAPGAPFSVSVTPSSPTAPAAPASTAGAPQPRGYMIANYSIDDQEGFRKYMDAAGPLGPKYKSTVIIFDLKSRVLEGDPQPVMAVAEFPSVADVEHFYNSPDYVAARQLRIASTTGSVVLAEGVAP